MNTNRRVVSMKQFRVMAEKKAIDTDGLVVCKEVVAEVKQEGHEDDRTLHFTISTGDVDREGDIINPLGWELGNFEKSGTVLWAHNGNMPPIAKPLSTSIENNKLKSVAQFLPVNFAEHEHVKFADMIYLMYIHGFMKAVSVGFNPIEWTENQERNGWWPMDFIRQELMEYSAVPVPANPNALQEAKGQIDLTPMKHYMESYLDGEEQTKQGLWIPKSLAQELYDTVKDVKGIVKQEIKEEPETLPESALQDTTPSNPPSPKGAISYNGAHPDGTPLADRDAEWDGSEVVANATIEQLPHLCAWFDEEDSENKSAYKLPHHEADEEYTLVWKGVTAAMGSLLNASGGVDIPEEDVQAVYEHLAEHYKEFGEEAPALDTEEDGDEEEPEESGQEEPASEESAQAEDMLKAAMGEFTEVQKAIMTAAAFTKAGRVLSSTNEETLRQAHTLIGEVLAKLDKQDDEPGQPDTEEDDCDDSEKSISGSAPTENTEAVIILSEEKAPKPETLIINTEELKNVVEDIAHEELFVLTGKLP